MSIFHKNSGKGYNICKKFQIGSVILMTQMTNQKQTELVIEKYRRSVNAMVSDSFPGQFLFNM